MKQRIADVVVKHYFWVIGLTLALCVLSAIALFEVKTNFNLTDYLPPSAPSTLAIEKHQEEFGSGIPNVDLYLPHVSLPEALQFKKKLLARNDVEEVYWLDDVWDLSQPLGLAPQDILDTFYLDGGARYILTVSTTNSLRSTLELQELAGPEAKISGALVDTASTQRSSKEEALRIFLCIFPIALFLMVLATNSYLDPLLLVLSILLGVLLNMGSNIFLGEISFLTASVAPILQMTVSVDYAIFLLHRYGDYCREGLDAKEAMRRTIPKANTAIMSSSLTTLFGFLALLFMRFRIGADLGIVLAKGIALSFLSVTIFLPATILATRKWSQRLQHRNFLPNFGFLGRHLSQLRLPIFLMISLLLLPAYLSMSKMDFHYGMDGLAKSSREYRDREFIQEHFGVSRQFALLLPRGDWVKEAQLEKDLRKLPEVQAIISYDNQVGKEIPAEFVPKNLSGKLLSPNYSRLVLTARLPSEGETTFRFTEEVRACAQQYYENSYYLAAEPASLLDMRDTVTHDTLIVNGLAILAIGLVLVFTFRSISIPIVLLLTIEASIWMNLSVPYFTDTKLSFIGYLVISTVQLGATVDYGILFAQHYLDYRKQHSKLEAIRYTIAHAAPSLLPPALILTTAGILLRRISSIDIVSELGSVLARGTVLSLFMVQVFLPTLLYYFDPLIEKLTFSTRRKNNEKE